MKIINRSILPLLACLAVLGLGLAFTPPAEARSAHHRNYYKSEYNCPTHGRACDYNYRPGYKYKNGRGPNCAYYNRYHRGRDYAYNGHKGYYRNQDNYYRGHNYRGHR